jgi:uncharacterized membrane protein YcaP (DUF421 family)
LLREKGYENVADIKKAILELDGHVSVIVDEKKKT